MTNFTLAGNLFNSTASGSVYPWGQDVIITLLIVIAFCQLFRLFFDIYKWWRARHNFS